MDFTISSRAIITQKMKTKATIMNTEEKEIFVVGIMGGLLIGIILTHFCYQIGFSEILSHEKIKPDYTIKIHGDKIDTTFHYHN